MSRFSRRSALAAIAAAAVTPSAAAVCAKPRGDIALLQNAMARGRFVTYQPTAIHAINGNLSVASDESIESDLKALREKFDSLITYGSLAGAERIPDVAAKLHYRAVVVGVWDPASEQELSNALGAWKRNPKLVCGVSLGNEIVFGKRGTWSDIARHLEQVRTMAPGLPISTTEPFAGYLDHPESSAALAQMDFLLANIHPIFEPWYKTAPPFNWADFVVKASALLAAKFCGPILVKETGVPSGPASAGFDENKQAAFWRALEKQFPRSAYRAFSYFSAFDAPWRVSDFNPVPGQHPEEAHWGLFTENRIPKLAAAGLPPLH